MNPYNSNLYIGKLKIYEKMACCYRAYSGVFLKGRMTPTQKEQLNDFISMMYFMIDKAKRNEKSVIYMANLPDDMASAFPLYESFLAKYEALYKDSGFTLYPTLPDSVYEADLCAPRYYKK